MTITGFTFKSYDKKAGVLQFEIKNQDGSPTDLIDATVRLFMYIYQGEEKKEFPIFDNQIITESYMQGIVKYRIPDMLLSYEGKVDANVYIDFPDGSHTDNLAFTFNIEKSVIDDNVQLNGEYYFKDFQQLLDGVKQEATDAVNEALAKVEVVSENVSSAQNDLTILEDRIDQTNQQIGDLGKLKKMYSNSIDFGNYDYSGRANLMTNLDFSKISRSPSQILTPGGYASDGDSYFALDFNNETVAGQDKNVFIPFIGRLEKSKTYALTIPVRISEDFSLNEDTTKIYPYCTTIGTSVDRAATIRLNEEFRGKWGYIKTTFTVPSGMREGDFAPFFQIYSTKAQTGKLYIGYDIKIEKVTSTSDTATPYQPNLLDEPYYLSKAPLGENIADPAVSFPIKTSAYRLYGVNMLEEFKVGQRYTITIKGTKPATQDFWVFNSGDVSLGKMKPVEGLSDIWTLTFTPNAVNSSTPKLLAIYQTPQSTAGACQIDWLKIEKGDTRTPNISQFKYFGEGLKDSNNPNDYSWDVTPEYTEKGLNNTVSLTEPQSVEGLKNFEDGLQIAGKEVATVLEDTGWVNLTAINGHSWNKQGQIRRIGKLVMFRGSLKGSTLSTQDFCTIPEGFRPSNPTDNYEYQFLLPPQSSNTLDNGGMAYIRPNGVCGLPSFRGTVNLFLAPIQYYID
ncbi:phage baseplate upper protein [Enterococcus faecium]|uniref:BppU family phage baseplate upper protein n=1 Tax=Enterococcus faecium TaxID=1352 RepID=UPI00232BB641|nr:BppU family phage baseplate upper protein [Enterococcus faecium]UXD34081.1 phage baseplate upper protein [Enterococcus faecium]